jgi:hypothetical protein
MAFATLCEMNRPVRVEPIQLESHDWQEASRPPSRLMGPRV